MLFNNKTQASEHLNLQTQAFIQDFTAGGGGGGSDRLKVMLAWKYLLMVKTYGLLLLKLHLIRSNRANY